MKEETYMENHNHGPSSLVLVVGGQQDPGRSVCMCGQQQLLSCLFETPQPCRGRDSRSKKRRGCDGDEEGRAHGCLLVWSGACVPVCRGGCEVIGGWVVVGGWVRGHRGCKNMHF